MYGPREDAALCGALQLILEHLLGDFAYIPFGRWAPMVPDPDPIKEGEEDETTEDNELIQKVVDFVFMDNEDISQKLNGTPENAETRASHTTDDMYANRIVDSGIHTTDFLNQNSFSKESSQQIQTWIKAFLGL